MFAASLRTLLPHVVGSKAGLMVEPFEPSDNDFADGDLPGKAYRSERLFSARMQGLVDSLPISRDNDLQYTMMAPLPCALAK